MEFLQELIQEEELALVATESIVINARLHRLLYLLVIETLILGCQPRQCFFLKIKSYQLLGNTQKGFFSFLIYFAQIWNIVGSWQYKKQFNKFVKFCRTSFFIKYSTHGIRIVQYNMRVLFALLRKTCLCISHQWHCLLEISEYSSHAKKSHTWSYKFVFCILQQNECMQLVSNGRELLYFPSEIHAGHQKCY